MADTHETIEQMIDAIESGDYTAAQSLFNDAIADKVLDSLDAERVAVAAQIYGVPEIQDGEENIDPLEENDLDDDE